MRGGWCQGGQAGKGNVKHTSSGDRGGGGGGGAKGQAGVGTVEHTSSDDGGGVQKGRQAWAR